MLQCRYKFIYVDRRCSFKCLIPLSGLFGVLRFPFRWRASRFRIPAKNFAASCLPVKSRWNNICPVLCLADLKSDMAYSIDAITDGCYPGTTCLVNKLGIQDESVLAETEAAVVLGKASLLDQKPIQGNFDFEHYKRIHHFLFCDLYDWAGQVRSINVSKKGTAFVSADEIE